MHMKTVSLLGFAAASALVWHAAAQDPVQPVEPMPQENAMVRFVHLSPNAESADVSLIGTNEEGVSLTPEELTNLAYQDVTDYIEVPAGEYRVTLGVAAVDVDDDNAVEDPAEPTETVVEVWLVDGAIEMMSEVPAGLVTFEVINDGTTEHDLAIEGVFDGTNGPLAPGETATVTVDLEPGSYRVYCPVEDHAEQGMELELTVTEAAEGAEAEQAAEPAEAEEAEEAEEQEAAEADEPEEVEAEEVEEAEERTGVDLDTPAIEQTLNFGANRHYTVAIIGLVLPEEVHEVEEEDGFFDWLRRLFTGEDPADPDILGIRFELLEDDMEAFIDPDQARIRAVHAAPGSANMDVAVAGERGTLVRNVGFGDVSRYVNLEAGETMLEVRPTGSRVVALDLSQVDFELGMIHTIFVTGTPIEAVPLEAVVLSDRPVAPAVEDPADPMMPAEPEEPVQPVDPDEPPDEPDEPDEPEETNNDQSGG